MNDAERTLLQLIVDGDLKRSRELVKTILLGIKSERDKAFKERLLKKLDTQAKKAFELPYNLQDLLIAENTEDYPEKKFLLRERDEECVRKLLATYHASQRLQELGIPYLCAGIFHGPSGTGKTELAKYVAYRARLPYIYVRFSSLVNSLLGGTQSNISKVFAFARSTPCVLCFDEIDAIGMKRGDQRDVSEISRVTIALMQELDNIPNTTIIIATTNRFDRLDPALIRRFPISHEVTLLNTCEAEYMTHRFLAFAGYDTPGETPEEVKRACMEANGEITAAKIIRGCTEYIVNRIVSEKENR